MRRLLSIGTAYNTFIYLIGKFGFARLYLFAKYIPYCPGTKVLDLGCGPGTNTEFFQPADYLGIDISEAYISKARQAHPGFNFACDNFLDLDESFNESYDLVLMSGLLHHLNDEMFMEFMAKSYALIKKGGRLIAIENCLHQKQSKLKRKLILMDRGKYVREVEHTRRLIEQTDFNSQISIEEDLLMIPYSHLIATCQK